MLVCGGVDRGGRSFGEARHRSAHGGGERWSGWSIGSSEDRLELELWSVHFEVVSVWTCLGSKASDLSVLSVVRLH